MNIDFFINTLSLLSFLVFTLTSFIYIEKSSYLNKTIYLVNLVFLILISSFHCYFELYNGLNKLSIIASLLILILLCMFFVLSIFSYKFIRLRLFFIPFFLILIVFRFLSDLSDNTVGSQVYLFQNNFLIVHIISSLLSYSMLTISAITSISVFVKEKALKKIKYIKNLSTLLPSIYETENLTINFLYLTSIFLLISLISGIFYSLDEYDNLLFLYDYKSVLSMFILILVGLLLIVRGFWGLTGKITFKIILICYVFLNLSYFGIKLIS